MIAQVQDRLVEMGVRLTLIGLSTPYLPLKPTMERPL